MRKSLKDRLLKAMVTIEFDKLVIAYKNNNQNL